MPTLVYAHRGASAELPENTMQAFTRAVELGADILETDAYVTRDGHVVLAHDSHGRRMANVPRAIEACTFDEVRAWDVGWGFRDQHGARCFAGKGFCIPTLKELLDAFPEMRFNIDAKVRTPAAVDRILEVIRSAHAEERVQLASFSAANLRRVRASGYRGLTGLAQTEVIQLVVEPSALLRMFPLRGQLAQVPPRAGPFRFDTPQFLDKAHALGLQVDYWVVDDPREAKRLARLGADGIMTDDPARVVPAVREVSR
jgi:glycerophosphoryl diester phosphodiesterase